MKTGIIVAMDKEFELVCQILQNPQIQTINHWQFAEGEINQEQIILLKSGIGKVCSAIATAEMINKFKPERIINTGVAGGLDRQINIADIVVAEQTAYHDVWCGEGNQYGQVQGMPAKFDGDITMLQKISQIKTPITIHQGLLVSGDKFIETSDEKQKIKNLFPTALAVDMESAAMAEVCYLYNVPFLALRIISDVPGCDTQAEQYQKFWQNAPAESLSVIEKMLS